MSRYQILISAVTLLAAAAAAGPTPEGTPLPAAAEYANESDESVHVLFSLAPGETFVNTTDRTLTIFDARGLRTFADAVADPQVIAHEDAIADIEARLGDLDAELSGLEERRRQQGGAP